ncbi:MAG: hypothetical protein IPL61_18110 [Myxococcales bacterium]|nr:hypothetical protein [Myxococcales bacterium]
MGMLHIRPQAVALDELIAASRAIALVRPADPPQRVVHHTLAAIDAPGALAASYVEAYDRFEVIDWVRALPDAPTTIEVASPHNAASARDAQDAAHGMLGHVHHVLLQSVVEVPAAWRELPDERRLLFMAPVTWTPLRFGLVHDAVLGPAALEPIRAAVAAATPPPPVARRGRGWIAVALVAAAVAVAVAVALVCASC